MEDLEKWKELHRAKPVTLAPRRLGEQARGGPNGGSGGMGPRRNLA